MVSLLVKKSAFAIAAAGLLGLGLAALPSAASAAPATGASYLCVTRGSDFSAVLQYPNRGGLETVVITPGSCSVSGPDDAGQTIVVLGNYNGAVFNLGNFTGTGGRQNVQVFGAVGAGTESFTVSNS
jgi:hypothetical protein